MSISHEFCYSSLESTLDTAHKASGYRQLPPEDPEEILLEARSYLQLYHEECGLTETYSERLRAVQREIIRTGTYWQTPEELAYGAKVAWRNNTRCIGRLHWHSLNVRDMRHLTTAE